MSSPKDNDAAPADQHTNPVLTGAAPNPARKGPIPRSAQLKMLLPQIPNLLLSTASWGLSLSETSRYWDLRSTLTVEIIRSFMRAREPALTVEQVQRGSMSPAYPENMWKHDVSYAPAADEAAGLEAVVRTAIESTGGTGVLDVGVAPLTAEWIGCRRADQPDPARTPAADHYSHLVDSVDGGESGPTILYLHGGAYFLMDPCTHRPSAVRLAHHAKCRLLLPRYRLAPQHPFPAALLDALISYLYLLHPPAHTHAPIPPQKIIFAGDSAGGGLALSLLLLLHHLHTTHTPLRWAGRTFTPPLPAAVATLSPWCDLSRAFSSLGGDPAGSEDSCARFDILPAPAAAAAITYADSPAWNPRVRAESGRSQFYAPDRLLMHPFVSPLLAERWPEEVPHYINTGDECLRDQVLYTAARIRACVKDGRVRVERYEKMPHVFASILTHLEAAEKVWERVGGFVRAVTGGGEGEWGAVVVGVRGEVREMREEEMTRGLEVAEVREMVRRAVREYGRLAGEGGEGEGERKSAGASKI